MSDPILPVPDSDEAPERLVHVLPETLANKIAAGEVVQRPASALKELMENALDAGARHVTVVLRQAGSELVQVVDDGGGMSPEDAVACFGRHATSKIRAAEDLERIRTLGFRGEALASIAAVAQVELRTRRQQDAAGTCVRIEGGRVAEQAPCAAPAGTSVAVRNLFFNVPARRNFLRSPATEFKHLVETFQFLALSNPEVGFTLVHDEAEVYRLASSEAPFGEALRRRIVELMGARHEGALVPVAEATSYLSMRGYVGRPEEARRSRGEQFLFVNGRYVKNRALEHAVTSAFEGLLPEGTYPFFTLFLTVDPRHVDVNVHPTKTEVKFDDERGVYGFVRAVVKKALGDADLVPALGDGFSGVAGAPRPASLAGSPPSGGLAPRPAALGVPAEPYEPPVRVGPVAAGSAAGRSWAEPVPEEEESLPAAPIPSGAEPLTGEEEDVVAGERSPVWQLHNRYIVTPVRSGLMLFEQQAAHERILYEAALTALEGGLAASQQLLFPVTLEFAPAEAELLAELAPDLRRLGFDLALLEGRAVQVHGVPADVRVGQERTILEDVLDQYKAFRDGLALEGRENLARSLARRSAIRPGRALSEAEARSLIDQLFACTNPYVCPHGRPTMVRLSLEELEGRFRRG